MDGDILYEIENLEWENGRGGAIIWYFVAELLIPASKIIQDITGATNGEYEECNKIAVVNLSLLNGLEKISQKLAEWESCSAWHDLN